jgi:SAM-dependent methyltransferase
MSPRERLEQALAVARPVRDILQQRVVAPEVPAWCRARGWESFLLGLDDAELQECEAHGLIERLPQLPEAPKDLRELAQDVQAACELPRLQGEHALYGEALRNVKLRKRTQLAGLLAAVSDMAGHAARIVDVGAGSGHFTRLSAQAFQRPALGLERSQQRVEAARARARGAAEFVSVDATSELRLEASDLAVGLHACGDLGDYLAARAASAQCDLALVSCCLQKISAPIRRPLSGVEQFELRREHLGLTNVTAQPRGVEASIEATIAARQTRYALGSLLRARGVAVETGAELQGMNRRTAHAGLRAVAARALAARNLPPVSEAELEQHQALAAREYGVMRRLSLPRSMLSRLVELLVTLDRAAHLEEAGQAVTVVTLFDRSVSPRNIGIFASRSLSRLPRA